ncbi:MAG: hypothetical protein ACNS61_06795, partial [Candidatus Wenzhouxiangella sp. M2_3B_020]
GLRDGGGGAVAVGVALGVGLSGPSGVAAVAAVLTVRPQSILLKAGSVVDSVRRFGFVGGLTQNSYVRHYRF